MDAKTALVALFSKAAPKGIDMDEAAKVLVQEFVRTGNEIGPAIAKELPREVIDWVEEFLFNRADFIAQNASDSRVAQWQKLAGAASPPAASTPSRPAAPAPPGVAPSAPSPASPPPSAPSATPVLRLSALRGAKVEATAPTLGGLSISRTGDDRGRPTRDREKDKKVRGEVVKGESGKASVAKEAQTPDEPPADSTPGLVHSFQSIQDKGRVDGELVRERTAATRRETPAARKKRLDAEAVERRRRLDEDAIERQRRLMEEEEALRRRLAIEVEAAEKRGLAELRLAAEKKRLDEEADERREERRRAREEARDRKPPLSPLDRNMPPEGMMVIQSPRYIAMRDHLLEAVQKERRGETGAEDQVRELGREITRMAASNNRLDESAGGILHRMRRSLAVWEDVHDPKTFQANFITGIYPD